MRKFCYLALGVLMTGLLSMSAFAEDVVDTDVVEDVVADVVSTDTTGDVVATECIPCGTVTYEGCCNGSKMTYCYTYAEDYEDDPSLAGKSCLYESDCQNPDDESDPSYCGWISGLGAYGYDDGYYCGGAGEDPAGLFVFECPGTTCTPVADACTGNEDSCIMSDGCDTACKVCGDGEKCDWLDTGLCIATTWCDDSEYADVGYYGCCSSGKAYYCDMSGAPVAEDCEAGCGWDSENGYYACGGSGEDTTYPLECPAAIVGTTDEDTTTDQDVIETPDVPKDTAKTDTTTSTDTKVSEDSTAATDIVADTSTKDGGGSSGCSANGTSSPFALLLLGMAVLFMARRRVFGR